MNDRPAIGLINSHTKCISRNHHGEVSTYPFRLDPLTLLWQQPRMIGLCHNPLGTNPSSPLLARRTCRGVENHTSKRCGPLHRCHHITRSIRRFSDPPSEVLSGKRRLNNAGVCKSQRLHHVLFDLRGRRAR